MMARTRAEAQMSKTDFDKPKVISELLCVKHHHMSLDTFSMTDVADMIETLCTA